MKKVLSEQRQRILGFIEKHLDRKGYPPTVRDIQRGLGISSTSVVDYHLDILAREGYISCTPKVSRGIGLINRAARGLTSITVIGTIATGQPIPVPNDESWDVMSSAEMIQVSADIVPQGKNIYGLRIKGMSLIDALINDGDLVVMKHTDTADNGDLVAVWLKAEKEATLKKFYLESDRVRLQPANSQMQPIYVSPDDVEVQGKVICVIRKLE